MTTLFIGSFAYKSNTSGVSFSKSFKQFFEKDAGSLRVKSVSRDFETFFEKDGGKSFTGVIFSKHTFLIEIVVHSKAYESTGQIEKWIEFLKSNIPSLEYTLELKIYGDGR